MKIGGDSSVEALAYADSRYAASLREFGSPVTLSRSGATVLKRAIPGTGSFDAMGCYPLFSCRDWSLLHEDLRDLQEDLVSLTIVTDPFGIPERDALDAVFDVVTPFKDHHLVDLDRPLESVVARHHRKSARKALQVLVIEEYDPTTDLATWCELYGHLAHKHGIDGIRAFSAESFAAQAHIPGLVAFRALLDGEIVGMHWYLTAGDVVYAHLAALHPASYRVYASHGLFWTAMQRFQGNYRWLDMGAGSGAAAGSDGLTEFKAGWSTDTAATYVCGKVFDRMRYDELSGELPAGVSYFPAYRRGEFAPAATTSGVSESSE